MMLLVGIELMRLGRDLRFNYDFLPVAATVAGSIAFNMAAGFAAGLLVHYGPVRRIRKAASAD